MASGSERKSRKPGSSKIQELENPDASSLNGHHGSNDTHINSSSKPSEEDLTDAYRNVTAISAKLKAQMKSYVRLDDAMSLKASEIRAKIKAKVERIIMNAPLCSGFSGDIMRKLESEMWLSMYHDVVALYKKFKQTGFTDYEVQLLRAHLLAGVGHYYGLILKVGRRYNLNLSRAGIFPTGIQFLFDDLQDVFDAIHNHYDEKFIVWAESAIHRMLIYMGDLCRYLFELRYPKADEMARRYYEAAVIWAPQYGMPFNQLGTLAGDAHYGLDASYNYFRCLVSEKPFEGAVLNLDRSLTSNAKELSIMERKGPVNAFHNNVIAVRRVICFFMKIAAEFWRLSRVSDFTDLPEERLEEEIHPGFEMTIKSFFSELSDVLDLKPKLTTARRPTFLDPSLVFEMSTISLIFAHRMRVSDRQTKKPAGDSNTGKLVKISSSFALLLFKHVVRALVKVLNVKLRPRKTRSSDDDTPVTTEKSSQASASGKSQEIPQPNSQPNESSPKDLSPELASRSIFNRYRRQRAFKNLGSGLSDDYTNDSSDNCYEDDSDLSQLEQTAMRTFDALDINSEYSEDENDCEDGDHSSSSEDDSEMKSDEEGGKPNPFAQQTIADAILSPGSSATSGVNLIETLLNAEEELTILYRDSNLPSVKLFCDWVRNTPTSEPDPLIMALIATEFKGLASELVSLLNILLEVQRRSCIQLGPTLTPLKIDYASAAQQRIPLTVDFAAINLPPLSFSQRSLDFDSRRELTATEMGFICLENVLSFGFMLARQPLPLITLKTMIDGHVYFELT